MYKTELTPHETHDIKREESVDRRTPTLKTFYYSLFMRRRHGHRRDADNRTSHYVDFHDAKYLYIALAILALSCTDIIFTLILLKNGAHEANPVMQFFMDINTQTFIAVKIFMTVVGVVLLIAHRNFWLFKQTIRTETVLFSSLIAYMLLINYELVLLSYI